MFDARPPFALLKTIDTGPITNHVNFVHNANGTFAYVTVGGLNSGEGVPDRRLLAGRDDSGRQPAAWHLAVGRRQPRLCRLENADALTAIDTLTNKVIATMPIGQAPQAVAYVPNAVPEGDGTQGLQPLGVAGQAAHLALGAPRSGQGGRQAPRRRRPASRCSIRG